MRANFIRKMHREQQFFTVCIQRLYTKIDQKTQYTFSAKHIHAFELPISSDLQQ